MLNQSESLCLYRVTGQSNLITLSTWVCVMFSWLLLLLIFLLFIFLFDLCALPLLLKASFCLDFAAWKLLETLSMRRNAMRCDALCCESVCYRFNLIRSFRFVYLSILSEIEKHTYPDHTHRHAYTHTLPCLVPCLVSRIAHTSRASKTMWGEPKWNHNICQAAERNAPLGIAMGPARPLPASTPQPPSCLPMCFHWLQVAHGVCVMCLCVCTLRVYS